MIPRNCMKVWVWLPNKSRSEMPEVMACFRDLVAGFGQNGYIY